MTDAKRDYGKIDIRSWDFPKLKIPINKLVAQVSEVLRWQFNSTPPDIHISVFGNFSGPLRIRVNLPISPDEDGVTYSASLKSMLSDFISAMCDQRGKIHEKEFADKARHVVAQLRKNADYLEKAIEDE